MEKGLSPRNDGGTTKQPHAKKEPTQRLCIFHKNELKIGHTPKCKTQNYKTIRRQHRKNSWCLRVWQRLFR